MYVRYDDDEKWRMNIEVSESDRFETEFNGKQIEERIVLHFIGKRLINDIGAYKIMELARHIARHKIRYYALVNELDEKDLMAEYLYYLNKNIFKYFPTQLENGKWFWFEHFCKRMLKNVVCKMFERNKMRQRMAIKESFNNCTIHDLESNNICYEEASSQTLGEIDEDHKIQEEKQSYNPYPSGKAISEEQIYRYIRNNKLNKEQAEEFRKQIEKYNIKILADNFIFEASRQGNY